MASPKIKLLICLTTLSLLIGCVPAFVTPTPIPPIDPIVIGTFMIQTANAASTQTVAAMPPLTSTPTSTPTPRNTYTPEPSFTPVQPYLFPSPTPPLNLGYYRVKHDAQLAMYDFRSRTYDFERNQTPEIVPLYLLPKLTSGSGRTNMSGRWEGYINMLNDNDERKLKYLKSPITALFNTAGFPQMESLTMGGNIVTLDEIQGDWARVHTMDYSSPPSAGEVNYFTRPDLVHKFVIVGWRKSSRITTLSNPSQGVIYYPFVSNRPVWVQLDRLESFPILPMEITANVDVSVQPEPGPKIEENKLKLVEGTSTTLIAYYPSGSDVWGRVTRGGWIPLIFKGRYYTSWSMATVPPPQ